MRAERPREEMRGTGRCGLGWLARGMAAGALLLAASVGARAGGGQEWETYPSNLDLLRQAALQAATGALDGLPLSVGDPVAIQARAGEAAHTFWEGVLTEALVAGGYRVVRLPPPEGGATGGSQGAGGLGGGRRGRARQGAGQGSTPDSTGNPGGQAAPAGGSEGNGAGEPAVEEPIPPELAFTGPRIRFESVELALTYPRGEGGFFRGNGRIERLARATLLVSVESGPRAPAQWTGRGEGVKSDVVPQRSLVYVQSTGMPVAAPEWKRKGLLGRLVEPALVTGIVGGLVYLFYANRSD